MHISQPKDKIVLGAKERTHEWWVTSKEGLGESWGRLIAGAIIVGIAFLALANFLQMSGNTENTLVGAWVVAWLLLGGCAMDFAVRSVMSVLPEGRLDEIINGLLRAALGFVAFCMLIHYLGTLSLHLGKTAEMNAALLLLGAIATFVPAVIVESEKMRRRREHSTLQKKYTELQQQFDNLADHVAGSKLETHNA